MASAWGASFGAAFGGAFGAITPARAYPPPHGASIFGHGYRERTKKEIREDRERFGIPQEIATVIVDVAARQVERLELDAQKRFEEFSRELELRDIQWDARYLKMLNEARARLIDAEIGERLRQRIDDEQIMVMLIAASL